MATVAGLRLLIADDEPLNLKLMQAILESFSIVPQLARNGLEALELMSKEPFDVIIMDINMPVMDGAEAVRRFRLFEESSRQSKIPIIACSAISQPDLVAEFMDAGFDRFLPKPINIADFTECLSWISRK